MGNIIWILLEIYCSLQQWKNFVNRSRIDKVIAMDRVAPFFWLTVYICCVYCVIMIYDNATRFLAMHYALLHRFVLSCDWCIRQWVASSVARKANQPFWQPSTQLLLLLCFLLCFAVLWKIKLSLSPSPSLSLSSVFLFYFSCCMFTCMFLPKRWIEVYIMVSSFA